MPKMNSRLLVRLMLKMDVQGREPEPIPVPPSRGWRDSRANDCTCLPACQYHTGWPRLTNVCPRRRNVRRLGVGLIFFN